jgi:glyoxylase-like metal-dependent hydrolase (beta-lactamase superfamily II)
VVNVSTPDYDVRGALLLGRTHALVWDTLTHPRDMAAFSTQLGGRRTTIVYSHADWDHVWGTAGLPLEGVEIVGHRLCLARFSSDVPETLVARRKDEPGLWDTVQLIPPTRVFEVELDLDLGGLTLCLRHLPGHTRDCLVGFVPERGVLLAGDTVETPLPVVPPGAPLGDWIRGLRHWAGDPTVRTVVPAHGRIGGTDIITSTADYLQGLADGSPSPPAGPLSSFYEATHRANLSWRPLRPIP